MNRYLQWGINLATSFGIGYATAIGAGVPNKAALTTALVTALANAAGVTQTPPNTPSPK